MTHNINFMNHPLFPTQSLQNTSLRKRILPMSTSVMGEGRSSVLVRYSIMFRTPKILGPSQNLQSRPLTENKSEKLLLCNIKNLVRSYICGDYLKGQADHSYEWIIFDIYP